jgi:hypothetical protein
MPLLARHLAFAASVILIGSVADAAPSKRVSHREVAQAKQRQEAPPVDTESDEIDGTDDAADDHAADGDAANGDKRSKHEESEDEGSAELVDAPVKARKPAAKGLRSWHFAIGPNVWLASVDANVSVGSKSVGAAIDFFDLSRYGKYGIPVLVEGRYKRLSLFVDLTYGVIGLAGGNEIGPLMVTLDGTVSSLAIDGIAGFRLLGDDHSVVSLEARGGIRYQRTVISGSVSVSDNGFSVPAIVNVGADALAGARVFVRPFRRFFFAGTIDQSLFGSSTSTWSAGADANLRITSYFLLAVGWRTLTQQNAFLSTVQHGPRAALQLLF